MTETWSTRTAPRPLTIEEPDRDLLVEALGKRSGAIVVTGHFGNWDIAAKSLRLFGGRSTS